MQLQTKTHCINFFRNLLCFFQSFWLQNFCAFLLIGYGLAATARELHVSTDGEVRAALILAAPGDQVVIRNGRYADWQLVLQKSGNANAPIVLRAETPGQVVLTGNTRITIAANHVAVRDFTFDDVPGRRDGMQAVRFLNAHHSELRGNLFIGCGAYKFRHIVLIDGGSDDNVVRYNKFVASKGLGVGIMGRGVPALRNTISYNHFDGTTDDGEGNGQEPIQLGQQAYNDNSYSALVEFNLIENMNGDADPEMISVKMKGVHVRHNTLLHDGQGGIREIVLRHAADTMVEKNLLIGAGIRVFGQNHVVRGNQIIGKAGHPIHGIRVPRWAGAYPDTSDVEIADNVLIDTARSCISVGQRNDTGVVNQVREVTVHRNICRSDQGFLYGLDEPDGTVNFKSNLAWGRARAVLGSIVAGVKRSDPQFIHMTPFWLTPYQDSKTWAALMSVSVGPAWQQTTIGDRVRGQ